MWNPRRIGRGGAGVVFDPHQTGSRLVLDHGLRQKVATLAGAGLSLNSLWSFHLEIEAGSLFRVLPGYAVDDRSTLWLIYPKSHVLGAKGRVWMDPLLEGIGTLPAWSAR